MPPLNSFWLLTPFSQSRIRRPSNKIIVLELEYPFGPGGGVSSIGDTVQEDGTAMVLELTRRHFGLANEGFADGHVEMIDRRVFANPAVLVGAGGTIYTDMYVHYMDLGADR